MSGRFVSGGTISSSGEVINDKPSEDQPAQREGGKNTEWEAVQQELEAERRQREEQRLKAAAGGEQSLYDILQANKGESRRTACSPLPPISVP